MSFAGTVDETSLQSQLFFNLNIEWLDTPQQPVPFVNGTVAAMLIHSLPSVPHKPLLSIETLQSSFKCQTRGYYMLGLPKEL